MTEQGSPNRRATPAAAWSAWLAVPLVLVGASAPSAGDPAPPAPPAPTRAAIRATIHDPRSCEPDAPIAAKAAWTRVPGITELGTATLGFAGGQLYLFMQDRAWKPRGFRIDPNTRRVQAFDASPLSEGARRPGSVQLPQVRCIGGELVFWGDGNRHRAWGAIYDPARNAWRQIPPRGAPDSSVSSTDGRLLYVIEPGDTHELSAAAYDPAANRWLAIPPGPSLGLTWLATPLFVGGKLLVWGCQRGWSEGCAGAAYDPDARRWQRLAPLPADLQSPAVDRLYPFVLGDSLILLVRFSSSATARTLRLGSDLRWTADRTIAIPAEMEGYAPLGGHHQGFVWAGTWNAPSPPQYRTHRLRLAPDLSTTEVARLPDPRAQPATGWPYLEEAERLQAAGYLFMGARQYARTQTPDDSLWILH
jgi:hypothetical protein